MLCSVLCCAVLCCAVLCCAVLCCAVLCCAVLCCAVLCCAVLCCAVLCCAVLFCSFEYSKLNLSVYASLPWLLQHHSPGGGWRVGGRQPRAVFWWLRTRKVQPDGWGIHLHADWPAGAGGVFTGESLYMLIGQQGQGVCSQVSLYMLIGQQGQGACSQVSLSTC